MPEEIPETGLTLGKAKQFLEDNFIAYTMKKSSAIILGEYEWDVKCKEEIDDYREEKRNFRLYTKGLDADSYARWEKNQCPTQYSISSPSTPPAHTFLDGARAFLRAEVKADRIEAGELIYGDDEMERATATVIDSGKKEKRVLIKRANNVFSMEDYVHLSGTTEIIAK